MVLNFTDSLLITHLTLIAAERGGRDGSQEPTEKGHGALGFRSRLTTKLLCFHVGRFGVGPGHFKAPSLPGDPQRGFLSACFSLATFPPADDWC